MTDFEKRTKLEEVMNDSEFLKKVESAASPEELRTIMATKEIEVTDEDATQAYGILTNTVELPEEVLDEVNGGLALFAVGMIAYGAVYGIAFCLHQMTKKIKG